MQRFSHSALTLQNIAKNIWPLPFVS